MTELYTIDNNERKILLPLILENHIEAQWLAANDISGKLAEKLGYVRGDSYKTFLIN